MLLRKERNIKGRGAGGERVNRFTREAPLHSAQGPSPHC